MKVNTEKRLFVSDKLTEHEIQTFLNRHKCKIKYYKFDLDSLTEVFGREKVQSGLILFRNGYDTMVIASNRLYTYFPYIQQLYPSHDSSYSTSVYQNAGQNAFRALNNRELVAINSNSPRPCVLKYTDNKLTATLSPPPNLEAQLYQLVHGDTDRLWLWRLVQSEMSQRSNMKFITPYGFIGQDNDVYLYGSYNALEPESTSTDVRFSPKTFFAKLHPQSIGTPFLLDVRFGKGETNYAGLDMLEIEHRPLSKRDTSRYNSGLLSYTYRISTGKSKQKKLSGSQCHFLPSPLIQLEYVNPVNELATKGEVLFDYRNMSSYSMALHGTSIMFIERCDLGYWVFTYDDNYSFYIELLDKNSGGTFCCFRDSFHSISSNVDFRDNKLQFSTKNGYIHRLAFRD